jgi:hypothetical protein
MFVDLPTKQPQYEPSKIFHIAKLAIKQLPLLLTMQIRKAFLSFLSITLLLVLAWIFLLFNQAVLEKNTNHNLTHVPSNATFAMRIDGRELAEKTLFSVFLESKDEEIITLLQETLTQNIQKEDQFKNYGIDYLSDIVVFEVPYKHTFIQGLLVNVGNERLFKKNMTTSKNVYSCKDGVGVIFNDKSEDHKILKADLQVLANKIVNTADDKMLSGFGTHRGSGKFIETSTKGFLLGETSYFGRSNMLFELQENELLLSGKLTLNPKIKAQPCKKIIQPKGLHVSTSLIPANLNDSLNNWLSQFKLSLPPIKEMSLNFMGTKIINHSTGFFVVPQMELLIECEKPFEVQDLFTSEELVSYLDYTLENGSIRFQDERLYFKQLSSTSFYIGITKNPVIQENAKMDLLTIQGELKPIMQIEGGGMMTAFLEMVPIYRASKNLANHTESIQLNISKTSAKEAELKGNLEFSNGYYPMNEILKFLLVSQITE